MTTTENATSGQSDNATAASQTASTTTTEGGVDAIQQPATGAAATTEGASQNTGAAAEGAKPDGDPAGESSAAKTGDKPEDKTSTEGAPEEYAEFTAPDGVKLDAEVANEFKALAKTLNLSQEKAQQVVDLGPKLMQKWQAQQQEHAANTFAQWAAEAKADKEFGGDNLAENLAIAKKARDTFGTPGLVKFLDDSGLGNHPELIRAFYRAGKAISEDGVVRSGGSSGATSSAKSFYSNSNMNP